MSIHKWLSLKLPREIWLSSAMFAALVVAFGLYAYGEKRVGDAHDLRHNSYLLANELRQSSDELTRMARTYVATGHQYCKQYFQDILDIRDGRKPRPKDYLDAYWDQVLANAQSVQAESEPAVPLLELMRRSGFTDQELGKLNESKANSDALTRIEFEAFKLAESTGPDAQARHARALLMLFDEPYHQAKLAIMRPINEFGVLMDQRTLEAIHRAQNIAWLFRLLFIATTLATIVMLWRNHAKLHLTLGAPADEIHKKISKIGQGDFATTIAVAPGMEGSIFAGLLEMQSKLAESERRFSLFMDTLPGAVFIKDQEGTILYANRYMLDVLGASAWQGKTTRALFPPDLAEKMIADDRHSIEAGYTVVNEQVAGVDGQLRDYQTHKFRIPQPGQPPLLGGIALDVSEARLAEEALQHSEAHFRAFFKRSMVGMATVRPDHRWIEVNPALCSMLGYSREEMQQMTWFDLIHPDDLAPSTACFERALAGEIDEYEIEKRYLHKDGSVVQVQLVTRCLRHPDGSVDYFVAIMKDISKRIARETMLAQRMAEVIALNGKLAEAQSQLLQSEKMASIGQLAAGVAHEINNPIGFVTSNLGTLENYAHDLLAIIDAYAAAETPAAAPGTAQFDAVHSLKTQMDFDYLKNDIVPLMSESREGLARVAKIVRDLKDFSHAGESDFEWADLHQGLDSTLNIVWNELKYKCTLSKEYGELPQIFCVLSQLNQVFMNLLVNAAHAIPEKGEIKLRTGRQDDAVFVAISDNGIGIAPENLSRIFDPFFTTKPVGKGTGLGLSLVYSIVQKHHGRLDVQSTPGCGSTFTVWLPILSPEAQTQASASDD